MFSFCFLFFFFVFSSFWFRDYFCFSFSSWYCWLIRFFEKWPMFSQKRNSQTFPSQYEVQNRDVFSQSIFLCVLLTTCKRSNAFQKHFSVFLAFIFVALDVGTVTPRHFHFLSENTHSTKQKSLWRLLYVLNNYEPNQTETLFFILLLPFPIFTCRF